MNAIGPLEITFLAFISIGTLFWIWMLIDSIQAIRDDESVWRMWAVVVALTHFPGALAYLIYRHGEPLKAVVKRLCDRSSAPSEYD